MPQDISVEFGTIDHMDKWFGIYDGPVWQAAPSVCGDAGGGLTRFRRRFAFI